jgi:hypothetical protein
MFVTSQWQLWNLFAPDPPRLVTTYRVEAAEGVGWRELATVEPGTFPLWRRSTRFQLMRSLLRDGVAASEPAVERWLELTCAEHGVARGTPVRLTYLHYLIPAHDEPRPRAWWAGWRPDVIEHPATVTRCP